MRKIKFHPTYLIWEMMLRELGTWSEGSTYKTLKYVLFPHFSVLTSIRKYCYEQGEVLLLLYIPFTSCSSCRFCCLRSQGLAEPNNNASADLTSLIFRRKTLSALNSVRNTLSRRTITGWCNFNCGNENILIFIKHFYEWLHVLYGVIIEMNVTLGGKFARKSPYLI